MVVCEREVLNLAIVVLVQWQGQEELGVEPEPTAHSYLNKGHVPTWLAHSPPSAPSHQTTTTVPPPLPLRPFLSSMASKAAYKRVRSPSIYLSPVPESLLTPSAAQQGVCRDAEGASSVRLGRARREEYLEL